MEYGQEEVVSRPSPSPLAEIYESDEFKSEWFNAVSFHVAQNLLHLRRFRGMSQSAVGMAMGTSQPAVARIETAQENITLSTLERLVSALRGRFHVSIAPAELCVNQPCRPWWESADFLSGARWGVTGFASRNTGQAQQVVIGLEKILCSTVTHAGYILEGSPLAKVKEARTAHVDDKKTPAIGG